MKRSILTCTEGVLHLADVSKAKLSSVFGEKFRRKIRRTQIGIESAISFICVLARNFGEKNGKHRSELSR